MLDLLDQVAAWSARGRSFALATVVRTWGSSPREPGVAMAVAEDGEVVGSVSGGAWKVPSMTWPCGCWRLANQSWRPTASPTTTRSPSA